MPQLKRNKDGFSYLKLAIALIFLVNPCIRTVDLLADFVATIIICRMLSPYCDRAPGFTEAKAAFTKLGWLSFLKIPAFIVMVLARSKNTNDTDIITLFSFIFAIFEAYYLILAVKRLFDALFHVGLRGGADAIITSFPILSKGIRLKPEFLRVGVYIFAIVKSLSYLLPEMILLATTDTFGDPNVVARAWALYPVYMKHGLLITSCMGIAIAYLFFCYIRAVRKNGGIRAAVASLYGEAELMEIEEFIHAKTLKLRLRLLMIAGFFTLDFAFDSTDGIDLLPNFIYGIFLYIAICKLFDDSGVKSVARICTLAYTAVSLLSYVLTIDFLSVYQFTSLAKKATKDAFKPILFCSAVEFITIAISLVVIGILLKKFILKHTSASSELDTRSAASNRTRLTVKTCIYSAMGVACGLIKLLSLYFKFNQTSETVEINHQIRVINTGMVPWFDSFGFVFTLAFIAYGCYYFSVLCDEIDMKYL